MANRYLVDIGMNDQLPDVIRKANHNFRLVMAGNGQLASQQQPVDLSPVYQAIDDERNARQEEDGEINDRIDNIPQYSLPPATANTLGGVKVGSNLSIAQDGTLSADAQQYVLPTAGANTLGGVKVGSNLSIDQNGVLSAAGIEGEPVAIGTIWPYAGSTAPDGFLFCDGQAVSRTDYSELFAVIGTTFGSGDGSTTFNVPDLRGRTPIGAGQGSGLTNRTLGTQNIGAETVTLDVSQIPAHKHRISHRTGAVAQGTSGMWYFDPGTAGTWGDSPSIENTGGGGSHNNMQPSTVVNFIICAKGIQAIKGEQGEKGDGVPDGGTAGQVLAKASNADQDTEWTDYMPTYIQSSAPDANSTYPAASIIPCFAYYPVDNSLYYCVDAGGGRMTATRLNRQPIVKQISLGSKTVSANSTTYVDASIPAVAGYAPTHVASADWSHPGTVSASIVANMDQMKVYINLHNFSGNVYTENLSAYVLYLPA